MSKEMWKPGNMLYPLPAILVSCKNKDEKANIITVAWSGTICTDPAMVYISVKPERYSYNIIKQSKEFVINLTTKDMVRAVDYCGVRSGKDVDKFKETRLTQGKANKVNAPIIEESPVNIECKVEKIVELGSHHMFVAKILCVDVDKEYMNDKGKFELNNSDLMVYSHGEYYNLGKKLGTFGYSVKKKSKQKYKKRR